MYVLTMTDYFSKYVEAAAIPNKSAFSVARAIYKVYCRHGAPVSVICDQGKVCQPGRTAIFWHLIVAFTL